MDNVTPWWTVVGSWLNLDNIELSQRWMENYQTVTPELAEDLAYAEAQTAWSASGRPGKALFVVSGVFSGKHDSADATYAFYADRNIPAPQ